MNHETLGCWADFPKGEGANEGGGLGWVEGSHSQASPRKARNTKGCHAQLRGSEAKPEHTPRHCMRRWMLAVDVASLYEISMSPLSWLAPKARHCCFQMHVWAISYSIDAETKMYRNRHNLISIVVCLHRLKRAHDFYPSSRWLHRGHVLVHHRANRPTSVSDPRSRGAGVLRAPYHSTVPDLCPTAVFYCTSGQSFFTSSPDLC